MIVTNARVVAVSIRGEDGWSASVTVEYGDGTLQSFGPRAFTEEDGRTMSAFVIGVARAVGAIGWEDIKGRIVRIKREMEPGSTVFAIGHPLEDHWFDMQAFREASSCR